MNKFFCTSTRVWNRNRGFTLVETLVAVSIISLAIAGPITAASRAVVASQTARDQLIASYLAQEGIEYVRSMRDEEFLAAYDEGGADVSATAWTNFISGGRDGSIAECKSPAFCTFDPTFPMGNDNVISVCSGACAPLYLATNGIYTQQNESGVRTPFTRSIQAFDISGTEEKIVSTVSWSFHGIPYTVRTSVILTPWQ